MKKSIPLLILSVFVLSACGPKCPTPEMLLGVWEGDHQAMTFRGFTESDTDLPRVIGDKVQHWVVIVDGERILYEYSRLE